MKEHAYSSPHLRRRFRRAAEVLVDDSGLRENLTDEQATQLLEWGLAQMRVMTEETAHLGDDESLPLLQEKGDAIRNVMRQISRIMGALSGNAEEEIDARVNMLLEGLQRVTTQQVNLAHLTQVELFKQQRPRLDPETSFQILMDLIQIEDDGAQEEE